MEGYIHALIDTHKRKIKDTTPPHIRNEINDRILELVSILDYFKRKESVKLSNFTVNCKVKDLDTEIKKAVGGLNGY